SRQRHLHLSRYHPRLRGLEAMAVTRTHFRFRIDVWTANSESIVGHVAGIEDYELVLGTLPPRLRALAPRAHYPCGTAPGSARTIFGRFRNPIPPWVRDGGLMSYGPDLKEFQSGGAGRKTRQRRRRG